MRRTLDFKVHLPLVTGSASTWFGHLGNLVDEVYDVVLDQKNRIGPLHHLTRRVARSALTRGMIETDSDGGMIICIFYFEEGKDR